MTHLLPGRTDTTNPDLWDRLISPLSARLPAELFVYRDESVLLSLWIAPRRTFMVQQLQASDSEKNPVRTAAERCGGGPV